MGDDVAVLIYALATDGEVFDLYTDQVEAEFALLDVLADDPKLARVIRPGFVGGSDPGRCLGDWRCSGYGSP